MGYFLIILLLVAGLLLLLMEIFIPSHGLLTVGAVASLGAGLFFAFGRSVPFGIGAFIIVAILLPLEIAFGVKLFPKTWMGRKIMLRARQKTAREERSSAAGLFALEGKEGVTISACHPAGVADIEGARVDVVAQGMMIDADRPIIVVRVKGNRVVVKEKAS
ncbi:MAG: hypothetical protein J7M19_02280 [Planctomycetes bacterium]|nr:hypothetical protein [Planctomycetota bacterium]